MAAKPTRRGAAQIQSDVDEEIRFHLEAREAELVAAGMDPGSARLEALRRFGDLAATRQALVESDRTLERGVYRRQIADEVLQDLKQGARQLRARPLFALAAILTLGIGIGAATAIFGAADHVLLRPLPYREVDRVVTLWEADRATGERREVSPGNFLDWTAASSSFIAMGLAEPSGFDLTGDGPPQPVAAWRVSEGFFEALGVEPVAGRTFRREEFQSATPTAAVISHGLWTRRFGASPAAIGKRLMIDGEAVEVVGVLPRDAEYPEPKDLWVPKKFRQDELTDRRSSYQVAVARLGPGATLASARADLDRVAARLSAEHPTTNATVGIALVPLEERVLGAVRPALLVLLGAVAVMLLIACANVAGLQLARGAAREPELAVRSALGADRPRLVRQLLTESLLLGGLGGLAGVVFAVWATRALLVLSPSWLPRAETIAVDGRVLAFAVALTLGSALLFGWVPALRATRAEPAGALASGGRGTPGRSRTRLRSGLVVAEIALALVLLCGAGLLIRSFGRLIANDPGFQTEGRACLQLFLWDRNPTAEQRLQRMEAMAERFRALPGVEVVGLVSALPFHPSQIDARGPLAIEGGAALPGAAEAQVFTTIASSEYFTVMEIALREGRSFEARDRMDAPRVAIVNQALARRCFPGENPIGKRVRFGVMAAPESREIVGVVSDVRPTTLDSDPRPEIYIPYSQSANGSVTFVARTRGDAGALMARLRETVWQVDPQQSVYHAATVQSLIAKTLLERRFHLLLFGVLSLVALTLAGIGVYGLVSVTTSQRTHEIGVRIALGARPRDIVALILGEGIRLLVPGVILGVAGALALTRFMEGMLYGVRPGDPANFVQVGSVLALVALVGTLLPALRAALIEPIRALREG